MTSGLDFLRRLLGTEPFPRWHFGTLAVHGPRSAMTARRRALLLSDSFGPTVQINFLRPLSRVGEGEAWGMLTLTEASAGAAAENAAGSDLERLVAEFRPDVIVASRYAGPLADRLLQIAGAQRIPLVVHIDDNLLEVPQSDATVATRHGDPERKARLVRLLQGADLDYISTAALRQKLQDLGALGNRVVVAGIAGAAAPMRDIQARPSDKVVFGYMGSRSHSHDLEMVAPAIAAALRQFPQARFELFGSIERPAALAGFPIHHHAKVKDYEAFLGTLARLPWSFGLAPLIVDDFTCMKTNVKWIEYTAAAIPVIASEHPIYAACCAEGAGLLAASDQWLPAIARMIETPELRADTSGKARSRLEADFTLARLRQQVLAAFAAARVSPAVLT